MRCPERVCALREGQNDDENNRLYGNLQLNSSKERQNVFNRPPEQVEVLGHGGEVQSLAPTGKKDELVVLRSIFF